MQVHRVVVPGSRVESWTVLGDDGVPVAAVESWLAYLSNIGRSPNTVKAYAHDLKDFWVFIAVRGLDWRAVRLDDLGEYVAWLALPPGGRDGGVAVLPSVQAHVGAATVNRKLAALAAFYGFHARRGVDVAGLLTTWQAGRARQRVEAVLAPRGQGQAAGPPGHRAEGAGEAAAGGHAGESRRSSTRTGICGTGSVCPSVGLRPAGWRGAGSAP